MSSFRVHKNKHLGKRYFCTRCEKSFTTTDQQKLHERDHDNVRSFQCTQCSATFKRKSNLSRHMHLHEGIKRCVCHVCGKAFVLKESLATHMKVHQTGQMFSCDICGARFKQENSLRTHKKIHSNVKEFKCNICSREFLRKRTLQDHLKVHEKGTDRKSLFTAPVEFCTLCCKGFANSYGLKRHIRKHRMGKLKHYNRANSKPLPVCPDTSNIGETGKQNKKAWGHPNKVLVHEKIVDNGQLFEKIDPTCFMEVSAKLKVCGENQPEQKGCSEISQDLEMNRKVFSQNGNIHVKSEEWSSNNMPFPKNRGNLNIKDEIKLDMLAPDEVSSFGYNKEDDEHDDDYADEEVSDDEHMADMSDYVNDIEQGTCEDRGDSLSIDIVNEENDEIARTEDKLDHFDFEEVGSSLKKISFEVLDNTEDLESSDTDNRPEGSDHIENGSNSQILKVVIKRTGGTNKFETRSTQLSSEIEAGSENIIADDYKSVIRNSHHESVEVGKLVCSFCDPIKQFKSKKTLNVHVRKFHKEEISEKIQCLKCSTTFCVKDDLEKHLKRFKDDLIHGAAAVNLECMFCLTKYTSIASLKVHLHRYHKDDDGKTYRCNQCEKMFASRILFKNHVDSHNFGRLKSREECTCEICGTKFITRCSLRRHKRVFHKIEEDEETETEEEVENKDERRVEAEKQTTDDVAVGQEGNVFKKKPNSQKAGVIGQKESLYDKETQDNRLQLIKTASQGTFDSSEENKQNVQTVGLLNNALMYSGIENKLNKSNKDIRDDSGQSISGKVDSVTYAEEEKCEVLNLNEEAVPICHADNEINENVGLCEKSITFDDGNYSAAKALEISQVKSAWSGDTGTRNENSHGSCTEMNVDNCKGQYDDLDLGNQLTASIFKVNDFMEETSKKEVTIIKKFEADSGNKVENEISGKTLETNVSSQSSKSRFRRKFACKTCRRSFHMMSTLKQHMSGHEKHELEEAKPYSCEQCNKKFSKMTHLMIHTHKVHSKYILDCSSCPRKFATVSSLKTHIFIKHRKNKSAKQPGHDTLDKSCEKRNKRDDSIGYKRCNICGKQVTDRCLKIHMRTHAGNKLYKCSVCSAEFRQPHHLKTHIQTCHESTDEITCVASTFELKEDTQVLTIGHDNTNRLACSICFASFSKKSNLNRHWRLKHKDFGRSTAMSVAVSDSEFSEMCEKCGEVFHEQKKFWRHMNAKDCETTYQCRFCNQAWKTDSLLKAHVKKAHNIKPYACDKCSKTFSSLPNLARHKSVNHTIESDSNNLLREFMCSLCGKCFTAKDSLRVHMFTHTGDRPYKCSMCDASYIQSGHLHRHMKVVHEGKFDYKCQYNGCGKCFYDLSTLRVHERCHTDERPYSCQKCPQKFRTLNARKAHTRTHSMIKLFECHICFQGLTTKHCLQMHLKRHETADKLNPSSALHDPTFKANVRQKKVKKMEEKRFGCSFCNRKFTTTRGVYAHQRNYCEGRKYRNCENEAKYFIVQ